VYLARHGMHVLATDISPGMIAETEKKIHALAGGAGSARARVLPFERLSELRGEIFDGGCSNFGGLNCAEKPEIVARDLAAIIRPGGTFIATVMPRFCLWETAAFLARFRWGKAFRRLTPGGTLADLHGGHVRTFYFSPAAFRRAFAQYFSHVQTLGLAVFMPPPNFTRLGALTGIMGGVDDLVAGLPLVRAVGDHYTVVLKRRA